MAMKVVADYCIIPLGVGSSLTKYVAQVQRVLQESAKEKKVNYAMHSCGTNIEGEWDDVMNTIKRCHEVLHAPPNNAPRVHTTVRIGTRTDKESSIKDKVESVQRELNSSGATWTPGE
ncbi:uncharacterized protein EV422DRAFT_564805 [Fimicolochytrium jonesii]|uniref:uncharacterized protein n=1 Tax=Fimicolochytrium jonesii TaxID=1396493 RepID=UPI0022FEBBCD|nr:uncharacterized protein EV422DRAFT_564805 [Fimicolochytrium jonesii]KAI8824090.1 hypothetical protein EV422DRAFT_564805 [Fimicolochytrium jonesii]